MFSRRPVKKLSRQRTWCSSASRRSERWDPMTPAPPVTRIRMGSTPPEGAESEKGYDESGCSQSRQEPCRAEGGWITHMHHTVKSLCHNELPDRRPPAPTPRWLEPGPDQKRLNR